VPSCLSALLVELTDVLGASVLSDALSISVGSSWECHEIVEDSNLHIQCLLPLSLVRVEPNEHGWSALYFPSQSAV